VKKGGGGGGERPVVGLNERVWGKSDIRTPPQPAKLILDQNEKGGKFPPRGDQQLKESNSLGLVFWKKSTRRGKKKKREEKKRVRLRYGEGGGRGNHKKRTVGNG